MKTKENQQKKLNRTRMHGEQKDSEEKKHEKDREHKIGRELKLDAQTLKLLRKIFLPTIQRIYVWQ